MVQKKKDETIDFIRNSLQSLETIWYALKIEFTLFLRDLNMLRNTYLLCYCFGANFHLCYFYTFSICERSKNLSCLVYAILKLATL